MTRNQDKKKAILLANLGNSDLAVQIENKTNLENSDLAVQIENMTNLGNSDLAVQIENYGYIPLWDRGEPSQPKDYQRSSVEQKKIWDGRTQIIIDHLCPELGITVTQPTDKKNLPFSFRELTEALFSAYQKEPLKWQDRLYSSRLCGVIEEAKKEFELSRIIIFVTDQESEEYQKTDSIYLFKILEKWWTENWEKLFQKGQNQENVYCPKIIQEKIPKSISPVNQDELLSYYYTILQKYNSEEIILISLKGGTPQMGSALQIQSMIASKVILIDAQLYIQKVLSGESSPCELKSYFKYIQTQKYEVTQQLLSRFDFDGTTKVIEYWQSYVQLLEELEILDKNKEIQKSNQFLQNLLKVLDLTCGYFNLDSSRNCRFKIKDNDDLGSLTNFTYGKYERLLNLYTQCRIYWEINQIANFLARLSSFCEEILHYLIDSLDGTKYFDKDKNPNDWYLVRDRVEPQLWNNFEKLETLNNNYFKDWNWQQPYKLPGRLSKETFITALIQSRSYNIAQWNEIIDLLSQLEYWIGLRNRIIHSAEGYSKKSLSDSLSKAREEVKKHPEKFKLHEKEKINKACKRDDILSVATEIIKVTNVLLQQNRTDYIGLESKYYIYSDVINWINEKLKIDG